MTWWAAALPTYQRWEQLDLNYRVIADIKRDKCIGCGVCYAACYDGAHQAIAANRMGGSLGGQVLNTSASGATSVALVCPVEDCITMKRVDTGSDTRVPWTEYSKNPSLYPHIRSNRHDQ